MYYFKLYLFSREINVATQIHISFIVISIKDLVFMDICGLIHSLLDVHGHVHGTLDIPGICIEFVIGKPQIIINMVSIKVG